MAHQTIIDSRTQGGPLGKGQKVRLWKINDKEEYQKWCEQEVVPTRQGKAEEKNAGEGEDDDGCDLVEVDADPSMKSNRKNSNRIYFLKQDLFSDTNEVSGSGSGSALGSVKIGAVVDFDLCVDKLNGTKVASNIRVSDDPVSDGLWPQFGVIEYLKEGNTSSSLISGYIRSIPNDEKLPWMVSTGEVCDPFWIPFLCFIIL